MKSKVHRAFWDSSALVPLFCRDSYSRRSRELLRRFPEIVVWWKTPVEIHGAFVRLLKEGRITQDGAAEALRFLNEFQLRWREVLPVEDVRDMAYQCIDRFRLRSADSLQLGAALIWCNKTARGRSFVCLDSELQEAAREAGFEVHS